MSKATRQRRSPLDLFPDQPAAPSMFWLAGPMSAKLFPPSTRVEPWQSNNYLMEMHLRQLIEGALGCIDAAYREYTDQSNT